MEYDVIIVGAGMAGLTAAAYLSREGLDVLLCEKEEEVGGLVNSFNFKGFKFDGGIRAIENSGVVIPMLKQLGIEMDFLDDNVSIGLVDDIIRFDSNDSLSLYSEFLSRNFKENYEDIERIIKEIEYIMSYMTTLYGIVNPLFMSFKDNKKYYMKELLPWLFKYLTNIKKIKKQDMPVEKYLANFTKNQILIDIIAQHFFKDTPAFFAMNYLNIYLDYKYPKGGTGVLPEKMKNFIIKNKGQIKTDTKIKCLNPQVKFISDSHGNRYFYDKLIWAADIKSMYKYMDMKYIDNDYMKNEISHTSAVLENKKGGDSVLSLYLTVDKDKSYFENKCTEHLFYTPMKLGLYSMNSDIIYNKLTKTYVDNKQKIFDWIKKYCELTTYEISIPVLRDESLAPAGKTGLIISTLIDYSLVKFIYDKGWYSEFKRFIGDYIIDILEISIFNGIKKDIMDGFVSTPLTIEKTTANTGGAITGWAFTNVHIPAENKMIRIAKSVKTPIMDVYQAGQWSFSPSGLPISIMTGKLASDAVIKSIGR